MRFRPAILFAVAALAAASVSGAQEFYAQEKCSLCHIRESVFFDPAFVLPGSLEKFDEERVCASCHNGSVRDSRTALWKGAQHPAPPPGGRKGGGRRCSPCHSPHGTGGWEDLAGTSVSLRTGGDAVCTGCHDGHARGAGGIHRNGFPAGGCRECHRAHGGVGRSLLLESGVALCLRCHPGKGERQAGGHPLSGSLGETGKRVSLPQCMTCHPVHRTAKTEEGNTSQCRSCHGSLQEADKGGRSHPRENDCLSCHTFHAKAGGGGKGFRGKDMLPESLCGECHAPRVASSVPTAKEKGTHVTRTAEDGELCLRCHRIHGGAPGTRLLVSGKQYSCLECHEDQNTINETAGIVLSHPVFERIEKGRLPRKSGDSPLILGPAGEIVCNTCHDVHLAVRPSPLLAAGFEDEKSCFWCHETMRGKGHLPGEGGAKGPACGVCHRVHGKKGGGGDPWAAVCSACHAGREGHMPGVEDREIVRPAEMPVFDARGRRVKIGGGISCPTCHDPHGRPERENRLRKAYSQSGFLCSACHTDKESVALTPHDLRGLAGKSICEPCHVPHKGSPPWLWGLKTEIGEKGKEACRSCHKERGMATSVPEGGHPFNVIVPRPIPDGFPLFGGGGEKRQKGVMTCPTCHEVHGTGAVPLGGQGAGGLLRTPPGAAGDGAPDRNDICRPCHEGKKESHGNARCMRCHPPHRAEKAGESCGSCHPPRSAGMAFLHEASGRGCSACHPMHDGEKGSLDEDRCVSCHPRTERIRGTSHAEAGDGACRTCHPAHRDISFLPPKRKAWEELFPPDLPCLRCHNPEGIGSVLAWMDHPKKKRKVPTSYGAVVTMETPITMINRHREAGRPLFPLFDENGVGGMSGRMGCLTCHDPHAGIIMKSEDGRRSASGYLRDPSGIFLADVCVPCHRGGAGEHVRKFHELPRKID